MLRRRARPLAPEEIASPRIQTLIEDMRDTMRAAPGVGLAAPQVGESLQLVVIEDAPAYQAKLSAAELAAREREAVPFHVLINPTLTVRSDQVVAAFEGCLSFHGFSMVVPRARAVRVEALDEHGQRVVKVATGWYARSSSTRSITCTASCAATAWSRARSPRSRISPSTGARPPSTRSARRSRSTSRSPGSRSPQGHGRAAEVAAHRPAPSTRR